MTEEVAVKKVGKRKRRKVKAKRTTITFEKPKLTKNGKRMGRPPGGKKRGPKKGWKKVSVQMRKNEGQHPLDIISLIASDLGQLAKAFEGGAKLGGVPTSELLAELARRL